MDADQALEFLQARQPMPSDFEISDAEGETFVEILKFVQEHPDPRFVPLLVNSVSTGCGLGMYQHIPDALKVFDTEIVVAHLLSAINGEDADRQARALEWAVDFPDSAFVTPALRTLASSSDGDSQIFAVMLLEVLMEQFDIPDAPDVLRSKRESTTDSELRALIDDVLNETNA